MKIDSKNKYSYRATGASQITIAVKNPPANADDVRDVGSIPELGRPPGGRHGNTPVLLPGESNGQRSLAGSSP